MLCSVARAFSTLQSSVSAPQQVGPDRHACNASCSQQTQGGLRHVACMGLSYTEFEPPSPALRPQTVQILAPIHRICSHGVCDLRRNLQNKVNSLTDARDFYDPETSRISGASHVPSQPWNISSPRGMLSRDSGLPLGTRNTVGTSGNVFEGPLARGEPSSAFVENSKNLASSWCSFGSGNTGNIVELGRV